MTKAFFDTNVLIYLLEDNAKAMTSAALLEEDGIISVQILNEFVYVGSRKKRLPLDTLTTMLRQIRQLLDVVPSTVALHDDALRISERYGFGIYDSLIVAAALEARCSTLYTEDLQHGQVIDDTLRIVNPFV